MSAGGSGVLKQILFSSSLLALTLVLLSLAGICLGSSESSFMDALRALVNAPQSDPMLHTIIWQLRVPRVLLAGLVGATLSLGGLVFQAILRNSLAEPYILGISGGAAIGAIVGILLGLPRFPGVTLTAFAGSSMTLVLLLMMTSGRSVLKESSLLLSGVMVNAFCSAVIMFLVSLTQDTRLHNIIFWLMGDLSQGELVEVVLMMAMLVPCILLVFRYANAMNLFLMGRDIAKTMGVNIRVATLTLLLVTSLMVSATVSYCGLIGFVGLVIPHLLRLVLGADHRVLAPACVIGGACFMVACDILARTLPAQGEMPVGVITAMIGAPIFIILLKRST
ncbi:MAG: iron ABC transporter permease [Desulfobacterales bacterium]|jgi:iron complex transport system permease protein|nr:iron ABC transporter permease [Desulfobacterales bacterium]